MRHFGHDGNVLIEFYDHALAGHDMDDFEDFQLFRRTYAVSEIITALS